MRTSITASVDNFWRCEGGVEWVNHFTMQRTRPYDQC